MVPSSILLQTIKNLHLTFLGKYYNCFFLEKYLTTRAPTTLTPPLCIFHREKAMEMKNLDVHMSIPECDSRGLYQPIQCDRQSKYCWCVNIHIGVEIYGTRKSGGAKPDCLING
jgi:hypothetical protein